MGANEVGVDGEQRAGMGVLLGLLERASVSRVKRAGCASPCEVLTLDIGRAHVLRVGRPFDPGLDTPVQSAGR